MQDLRILCPKCGSALAGRGCLSCGADWAGPLGMLDFSPGDPRDALLTELLERAAKMSFPELFEWYLPHLGHVHYATIAEERCERMAEMFSSASQAASGKAFRGRVALDLGCGQGAMLVALAWRFEPVIGIDLNPKQLALAAARVRHHGLTNVVLIKGVPGKLPIPSESLDVVVGLNVLEHLVDALDETLAEIRRILTPGGIFCADSRNRYDVVFPEPHVHLRFVGFLPRSVQGSYVTWRTGLNYADTRLLSPLEAQRKLREHIGTVHIRMSQPSAFGK